MIGRHWLRWLAALAVALAMVGLSGCGWRGLNSMTLPGTVGTGPGSFTVRAEMPDVATLRENSRVLVGDVTVGNVAKIESQDWHALVTLELSGDVDLPANATAQLGQTSLLGSVHVELSPPTGEPPEGRLGDGSLIPLSSSGAYPSTEQTLAAASLLLNGGGLGQLQDINVELATALDGRAADARSLIGQMETFVGNLNEQTDDIIQANESLNRLTGQFAEAKLAVDEALKTIPDALEVLSGQRTELADAVDQLGSFSALTADVVDQTKQQLVTELDQLGPVLGSLADAGPDMTRSLSLLATYPWPNETLASWVRGDYANLTAVVDLTLSRIDADFFTGTRWEGQLTELEMQWGRTIGQLPSPYTVGNPLVVPYRWDQGP